MLVVVMKQNQGVIIDKINDVGARIDNAHKRMDHQDERIDTLYDLSNSMLQSWQRNASHAGQHKPAASEEKGNDR